MKHKRTRNHHRRGIVRRYSGASDVRGFDGFPSPAVSLGLAAFALFLIFAGRKGGLVSALGSAFDFAKATAFKLALPSAVGQYSTQILSAAQRYSVDPWALAAIMYNESRGGVASGYTPQGPGGTGDFIPRKPGASTYKFANPATGLPPDGKGWGRGLMQIDYGVHNAWVTTAAWWDAQTNIDKGAEILRWNLDYFRRAPGSSVNVEAWRVLKGNSDISILPWAQKYPRSGAWPDSVRDVRPLSGAQLYEAAIAAYNVSYPAVLQALGLGLPAEAGTTRQDYVTKFLSLVGSWQAKFK